MYLSKFHLNLRNVMARKCLADCQIMHRSIQRLFHCSRDESGTLYRMDTKRLNLYVWSKLAPDLTDIPEGMELMGVKNLAGLEESFQAGRCYQFDLLAAPTKKVPRTNGNSQRRYLKTATERLAWLQRKGQQYGFRILHVEEGKEETTSGTHDEMHGGRMTDTAVLFQGVLQITQKELFCECWQNGLGPGKSYGRGMLLLKNA
ncbi:type I-E CRISPR-associated protein Cas6/Cse3/CasE [Selenomonas ruminantium]|uniref:CRISPR system Cascade subunit CasE n=1 Tax=Selenomonas ruminantium TaxID=971 RepID=A0A1K1M4X6_SELRU|nr:type I-E CRISPR-associated protein Cas6/Cse3/CasE [Selenomonas ruminantium]SFW17006.1 CRISPR system Cascade subunit CasE [Selenomonas ruminantium]